ncbi:MAG: TIGR04086 family membrane protein, partial [Clostridia bacterium]|nr:TIGR04086 family membrane protein [Clostridia bacterium]
MPETKKTRAKRRANTSTSSMPCWLRATLLALPVTLLIGLALLLLGTALLMMTKDPDRYHAALSLPLLYLTAFLGGLIATRMAERRSAFLCGLCEGVCLFALFTLLAICLPRDWA